MFPGCHALVCLPSTFRSVLPFLKLREGEDGGEMKVDEEKGRMERGCEDPDVVSWRDDEKEDRETERGTS